MPTMTSCPACSKQLRVPDELLGRQVKCPACGTTFTAAAGGAPPLQPVPAPIESAPREPVGGYETRQPSAAPPSLTAPGIALLISSILGLLIWGQSIYSGVRAVTNPEAALDETVEMQETILQMMGQKFDEKQKEEMKKQSREQMKITAPLQLGWAVLATILALLAVIGSVQMIRGRRGALPWMAAILNVVPCTNICCCTGIPFGIWAMMALHKAGKV